MLASSSLNMMPIRPISIRLCKAIAWQVLHNLYVNLQNIFKTHIRKPCVTYYLFWAAFFVESLFCGRTGSNRVKAVGQNTSWTLINVETFEAKRNPPPLTVRPSQTWPGACSNPTRSPRVPKAVNWGNPRCLRKPLLKTFLQEMFFP